MKKIFLPLALAAAVLLSSTPILADDGFYVIVAGGGVGTKISSLPLTINTPGFYYLTGNLSYTGTSTNAITVTSDDVTIDLMGFEISGPGLSFSANAGIAVIGHHNVEVRNGCLNGWKYGLIDGSGAYCTRALNLRMKNCLNGIYLMGTGSNQIKGCSFLASSSQSTGYAIYCGSGLVMGNTVATVINSFGIYIEAGDPCLVTQNAVMGQGTHFHGNIGTINVNNAGF
jgi:hypothetical protein